MIRYICNNCNIEIEVSECPHCGNRAELLKSDIYWCEHCGVPIFDKVCHRCGNTGKRISTDIRPVFPEERLLLEIFLGTPLKYKESSVWCTNSSYIVDPFKVPKGRIVGSIGENGAGKSTTINIILNEINKDSGSVELLGLDHTVTAVKKKNRCCF